MSGASTVGDDIARRALSIARSSANLWREVGGTQADKYLMGLLHGQLITARVYLSADRERALAADNEIRFLLGRYITGEQA